MIMNKVPVGTTSVNCDIAQMVNRQILDGNPPEDKELISQVIAHTALCDTCRRIFLDGRKPKIEDAKS